MIGKKELAKKATILATVVTAATAGYKAENINDYLTGNERYVVMTEPNQVSMFSAMGLNPTESLKNSSGFIVKMNEGDADKLREQGLKVYPDKIYRIDTAKECPPCDGQQKPIDPEEPKQGLDNVPWGTQKVHAMEALKALGKISKKVPVCVIDTGIATRHRDFTGIIKGCKSFVSGEASCEDHQGHGTHVAGTIAAVMNDQDVVGVASGVAEIIAIKALSKDGAGYGSWISDAVKECVKMGAKVINMSLGSPKSAGPDYLITNAIMYAASQKVHVAMANGNDSGPVGWPASHAPRSPYLHAIASMDQYGRLSHFSSRGPETTWIAPGSDIESLSHRGGTIRHSGTSMATPHVAAILALCEVVGCGVLKTQDMGLAPSQQGRGMPDALKTVKQ